MCNGRQASLHEVPFCFQGLFESVLDCLYLRRLRSALKNVSCMTVIHIPSASGISFVFNVADGLLKSNVYRLSFRVYAYASLTCRVVRLLLGTLHVQLQSSCNVQSMQNISIDCLIEVSKI